MERGQKGPGMFGSSAFQLLKKVPLFASLDSGTVAGLAGKFEKKKLKPNEVLFQQGDPGDAFYVIVEGAVKISVTNEETSLTVALLGPGDHLGEMALFDNLPRSAKAEAARATQLLALGRRQFEEALRENPDLALKLLQTLASRLREANAEIARSGNHPLFSRMARKLLHLTLRHGKEESRGVKVDLPISAELLAEMLGSPADEIELLLRLLESEGVLEIKEDHFWLYKVEPLLGGCSNAKN